MLEPSRTRTPSTSRLRRDTRGVSSVEYLLLIVLVALVGFAAFKAFGHGMASTLNSDPTHAHSR